MPSNSPASEARFTCSPALSVHQSKPQFDCLSGNWVQTKSSLPRRATEAVEGNFSEVPLADLLDFLFEFAPCTKPVLLPKLEP